MDVYGFVLAKESVDSGDFVVHGVEVNDSIQTQERIMITHAVSEMSKMFKKDNIYMLTNKDKTMEEEAKNKNSIFSHNNILLPRVAENVTTFGYAAMYLYKTFGDGALCIGSAESIPDNLVALKKMINKGIKLAVDMDKMILINTGEGLAMDGLLGAKEKKLYIWKASTFLNAIKELLPESYGGLLKIGECLEDGDEETAKGCFAQMPAVSLDLGVFSRATNVIEYFVQFDEEEDVYKELTL